MAEKGIWRHKI